MDKLHTKRVSKALGMTFAIIHAAVVLMLQAGASTYWGWAHMMNMPITVQPFNIITFLAGTAVAGIAGAVIGWLFATIYNKVN